jgi:hypothetical protein
MVKNPALTITLACRNDFDRALDGIPEKLGLYSGKYVVKFTIFGLISIFSALKSLSLLPSRMVLFLH